MMKTPQDYASYIKEQIGYEVELDEHFTGMQMHRETMYFNIILETRCSESLLFTKLERLCGEHIKKVEPNGINRAAVYV